MTFSEFGRRIEENGSRGTDHGEASPLFLIGGGVKGGLYGAAPDLAATNMGNVRFTRRFSQRLRNRARALARTSAAGRARRRVSATSGPRLSGRRRFSFSAAAARASSSRASCAPRAGCGCASARRRFTSIRGPGALVRALSHVPPCNPARTRRDRALAQTSRSFRRRQRADRGDDVGRFPPARRGARAGRRVRRRAGRAAVRAPLRRAGRTPRAEQRPVSRSASVELRHVDAHVHAVANVRLALRARRASRRISSLRALLRWARRRLREASPRRA